MTHPPAGNPTTNANGFTPWYLVLIMTVAIAMAGVVLVLSVVRFVDNRAAERTADRDAGVLDRRDVTQLTHEVLQARTQLRALEDEIRTLLADPHVDWTEVAAQGRVLAAGCGAAPVLPPVAQRESNTAYRVAVEVLTDQHQAFALAESWPVGVRTESGTRLQLRVVPAIVEAMPQWPAGRQASLCFAWLDDYAQPLLLADLG